MKNWNLTNLIIGIFLITISISACTTQEPENPFSKMFHEHFDDKKNVGIELLVAKSDEIIFHDVAGRSSLYPEKAMLPGYGFSIGSLTMQFTAAAILKLKEEGKLALHDSLGNYFLSIPDEWNNITIHHLLNHTSGLPNYNSEEDWELSRASPTTPNEILKSIESLSLEFEPGSSHSYCKTGYYILGLLIEELSGQSYREYLKQNIFNPLGMTSSSFEAKGSNPVHYTHTYAADGIVSTAVDLLKWTRGLMAEKVISKWNMKHLFRDYRTDEGEKTGYGYGWRIDELQDSDRYWHEGKVAGFLGYVSYLPDEDVTVIVLLNSDQGLDLGFIDELTLFCQERFKDI